MGFNRVLFRSRCVGLVLLLSCAPALAQTDGTWIEFPGGLWSNPNSWVDGIIANNGGVATFFSDLDGGGIYSIDIPVTLSGIVQLPNRLFKR